MKAPGFTVMIHRDGALDSRRWHIPQWLWRTTAIAGAVVLVLALTALVLYGPIVTAALKVPLLELRIRRLETENRRVGELARRLDEAEARYAHLRGMLGGDVAMPQLPPTEVGVRPASEERLWVAPPMLARAPDDSTPAAVEGPSVPSRWPLSVPSYRTRGLAEGDPGVETHAGLDLAVPVGSEVRASGGGLVQRTGTDSAYGLFVFLVHAEGYQTMYGHLSRVLVTRGQAVRAGQVIAVSGNTGRSTAPHLHFEIRRGGRSVDPLTLVREGT